MNTKPQNPSPLPEEKFQLQLQRYTQLCQANVVQTEDARRWLANQGMEDLSLFERYAIGWSTGDLPQKLPGEQAVRQEFVQSGLLDPKGREPFAGHAIFSLIDADGRYQTLWAIAPDGRAKFLPGRPVGAWNEIVTKHTPSIYVAAHPVLALVLISAGFGNVIAVDPKAGVVDLETYRNRGVQRLTIVVGDTPQESATATALVAKFKGMKCDVATLVGCAGVQDFFRKRGAKALAEAVVAAAAGVQVVEIPNFQPKADGFSVRVEYREYFAFGLAKTGHQMKLTLRAHCRGKMHVDTFDIYSARPRKEFVREAARIFDEPPRILEEDMVKLIAACELRIAQPDLALPDQPVDPVPEALRKEAEILGRSPGLPQLIRDHLTTMGIAGEELLKLAVYIVMTSRLMAEPLSIWLSSSFSAGKSIIVSRVSKLCPPDQLFDATHLSPKALLHVRPEELKHRFAPLEEMVGVDDKANYLLRSLISSGHLVSRTTAKDSASGRLYTETKRVEGPTAVAVTSSKASTDGETQSRFIVLGLTESKEQTRLIQERQRMRQGLDGLKEDKEVGRICQVHHAFQRLLQPLSVVFPDPSLIPSCDDRLTSRRDFPKIINLIKAVAFLRQMQKPVKQFEGLNYIEVDAEDLKIAQPLIDAMFRTPLRELSISSRYLLQFLHQMRAARQLTDATQVAQARRDFTFTMREAREYTLFSQTTLHRCKVELEFFDYLVRDTSSRCRPYLYYLDWSPSAAPGRASA